MEAIETHGETVGSDFIRKETKLEKVALALSSRICEFTVSPSGLGLLR